MTSLKGSNCRLRPVGRGDLDASLAWRNDPETRDLVMGYRFPVTETMESAWYDRVMVDQGGKRASFTIADLETDAPLGFVHLMDIDWVCRSCELGVVVGESRERGRGVGGDAVRLATGYAFRTLNLERIGVRVLASNTPACALFERQGFLPEGQLRKAAFAGGALTDVVLLGLLREEYEP